MSVAGPETTPPQLFVVHSQVPYTHLPSGWHRRKPSTLQRLLVLLVGLALLGLIVEGGFICYLYNKTQVATNMRQTGLTQPKPSAHLSGSTSAEGSTSPEVIQWNNNPSTATFTFNLKYKNGRFIIQEKGFYFLYSKVYLDVSGSCNAQLKLRKSTDAYGKPIELMRSKRFKCDQDGRPNVQETFMAGVFDLMPQDEIYVTLEGGKKMKPLNTESFMGAFMLY